MCPTFRHDLLPTKRRKTVAIMKKQNHHAELNGHFEGKKGLRQGDPISSLLFVMAMDVLYKMLDKGAVDQVFRPHPSCEDPLITHLSFADDVLIFFDGSEESLAGIMSILEEFKAVSGLRINKEKTGLLLDGGCSARCQEMAERLGIKQGALPIRYLGVPLSAKKVKKSDFQPLLDKVLLRFNSWTVRHLSFAGRFQLIQAVIYSTISFWASIFIIPKECIHLLEHMCNAFLWRGAPTTARGVKVSWISVCTPKEAGGLGLRRLEEWNRVLGLKLIWLIFAAGGSLWVSWVRRHLIADRNFWDIQPQRRDSWIWKSLCNLRHIARPMVICEVGNGSTARFWHDNWTSLGPLIDITGPRGPGVTGLHVDAVVAEALRDGDWWVRRSRSRNRLITMLRECLPEASPILNSEAEDIYLWKTGNRVASCTFSTADTWEALHPQGETVFWHRQVWFQGRIPKHAFITWVIARNRLGTRDRMRSWGLQVPATCILCNAADETRQHLFFDCPYSTEVWTFFCSRLNLHPPALFEDGLRWLRNPSPDEFVKLVAKLVFQAALYSIWKERNVRIHNQAFRPAQAVILEMKQTIQARLDPLSRASNSRRTDTTLLGTWFNFF